MESPGGISDGGVSIKPWQIPRLGGTISSNKAWSQSPTGETSQGRGSTGMGGGFAQWTGHTEPSWGKGLFGGWGERGVAR